MSKGVKIAKILGFVVLATIVITIVYNALSWKDNIGDYNSSMEMLYNTPKDTIDVAFVGNSHVYLGITPEILWRDYGYSAFDMTISGADKSAEYYALKELLKTQSPKVVFVDLHAGTYERSEIVANRYRIFLGMKPSLNSYNLVMEAAEKELQLDYLFRFPIVHTRYKELTRLDFEDNVFNSYGRGGVLSWSSMEVEDMHENAFKGEFQNISTENATWVNNLMELSEEYDFELVFMVCPYEINPETQGAIDSLKRYGEENFIYTIDGNLLSEDIGFDYENDFLDEAHLNSYGGDKFTSYIGTYLADNYDLADHRQSDGTASAGYEQWDLALSRFNRLYAENKLKTTTDDVDTYVDKLLEMDDIKCIVSLEGNYIDSDSDYYPALKKLGMSEVEYIRGGKWMYENGVLTRLYDNNPDAPVYQFDLSNNYSVQIKFTDDVYGGLLQKDNILINRENYSNDGAYLEIIVYDEFLDTLVENHKF